ncbi:MAG TPA: multiheme c-type cytochrome [Polyangiaceae bacterium]|nr:multiheme c-type cytochrome [Polyangiaceae bacterium]
MTGRHLIFAVPALALGLAACEGCRSSGGSGSARPPTGGDNEAPTVRLYLLSDVAGALEPCGCTKDQLGGLDHFGAWVKRERTHAPAAAIAAAGPLFFMDDRLDGERADQDRAKADTMARVLRGLGFVAFAPGVNDWADGSVRLADLAGAAGATAIVAGADPAPPFAPLVVRDLGGLRVGFIGFGQPAGGDAPQGTAASSVARGAEEARRQGANVLVALAAVGRGEAKRIADAVPELAAVVVGAARSRGEANTTAPDAEQVGGVLVVQGANHLQDAAVLDLYVREPVEPGRLVHFADATGLALSHKREDLTRRIDELHVRIAAWERDPSTIPSDLQARKGELADLERQRDGLERTPAPAKGSFFRYSLKEMRESLGKDADIEAQMLSYYRAVDEHNRVAFADRLPPAPAPDQARYVGMDVCVECHAEAQAVWQKTSHARAYESLSAQYKEFNLECVGCHVTGYERTGGSTVTHVEKLRNVQCEVCHGPGSKHAASPLDTSSLVTNPEPGVCLQCHHPPHVAEFDPAAKRREILGPGHGMPLKK